MCSRTTPAHPPQGRRPVVRHPCSMLVLTPWWEVQLTSRLLLTPFIEKQCEVGRVNTSLYIEVRGRTTLPLARRTLTCPTLTSPLSRKSIDTLGREGHFMVGCTFRQLLPSNRPTASPLLPVHFYILPCRALRTPLVVVLVRCLFNAPTSKDRQLLRSNLLLTVGLTAAVNFFIALPTLEERGCIKLSR